ncbi:hypothetical protein C8A05DRAFT_34570 [Staphylotrichum tortipilum]|uniref:Uncharacterized protein n=1 Tax=Staphylotrichum tortipilum TaxID=2831512 RepID=A0AAN6MK88_9PEZI|nr:hypothetical protein C8A05DRAFT_34570 [Staphylotrichum longicolle]
MTLRKKTPARKAATHPSPNHSTLRLLPNVSGKRRLGGAMKRGAHTYTLMDDNHPGCSFSDFSWPRLQQCPHDVKSIIFAGRINSAAKDSRSIADLDGGLDGYNWKIRFEDGGPLYVLKMLWDTEPPTPSHYFAVQREFHNAALLQMMQAALSEDKAWLGPVLVDPSPASAAAATINMFAFCDETRGRNAAEPPANDKLVEVTTMPRMRRCFGWMRFRGIELLRRMPADLHPPMSLMVGKVERCIDADLTYMALVYEFVEEGENDPAAMQEVLDFLWRAGFAYAPVTKAENWTSSVLLDHSEIVGCGEHGWDERLFGHRTAKEVLR